MLALRQEISQAAACDAKVLITGESGSGKEVVAQSIHAASARHRSPMMTINCAALTESLLETELFGHTRGSFTGAYRDRAGIFETANGGTVLLDEVGETSPRMQGMLLRFLETGEVQRVGSDRPHTRVNVRIISATNRVLAEQVASKEFREDLFYRLNIIVIRVPALREHPDDIPELTTYWTNHLSLSYQVPAPVFANDAMDALCRYRWPGNVRELRNVVERLVSRRMTDKVTAADLPPELTTPDPVRKASPSTSVPSRADELFNLIVGGGESFWTIVYEPFITRDLTRADLRGVVSLGLAQTYGNYRLLVHLFNLPPQDYKRFLTFLHKHHCHMPFQQFRSAAPLRMGGAALLAPERTRRKIASA